jgi:hypothetical protein
MPAVYAHRTFADALVARSRGRRGVSADPWEVRSETRRSVRFTSRHVGRWIVVTVTGRLDAASAPALKRELDNAVRASLYVTLDLDDAEVTDDGITELLSGMAPLLRVFGGEFRTVERA